jgi:polysaccharide chain length determinant protein (PEP-CTERM system associated)
MSEPGRLPEPLDEPRAGDAIERLRAVWVRRRWTAILAFVIPAVAGFTVIATLPNVYRSTAVVLIERQQVAEALVRPTVTGELEARLHAISQEALSRARLEELIRRLKLHPPGRADATMDDLTDRMRRDISIELRTSESRGQAGTTNAFALSYRARDPLTAAVVTNTLASFYVEENARMRERQATGTATFLQTQLATAKLRLDEQERRVSAFRAQHVGELPQQMGANIAQLESLNNQLRLNADQQVRAAERRQAARAQLAEASALGLGSNVGAAGTPITPESPAMRLARLRQELSSARARFHPTHPTLIRLRAEVAAAEAEAAQARRGDPLAGDEALLASPYALRLREAVQAADAEARILKAEEDRLKQTIAALQRRVENTPRREQEFQELARDYDATSQHYQSLLKRHEEAQLAETMEARQKGEHFRILDRAVPSRAPSAPRRVRLMVVCLALSGALAVGVTLLAEVVDSSFHSVQELRAFTLAPVLVSIPRIVTDRDRRVAERRFNQLAVGTAVALLLVVALSYAVGHGNDALVAMLDGGA